MDENAGTVGFTVTLSKTWSSAVTVDAATADGTATAGSDYTAVNRSATISAGSLSTVVSVSVSDDSDVEPDETFTLSISNPANASLGTPTSASATIRNDDTASPVVTNVVFGCTHNAGVFTLNASWSPPVAGATGYQTQLSSNPAAWDSVGELYFGIQTTTSMSAMAPAAGTYYAVIWPYGIPGVGNGNQTQVSTECVDPPPQVTIEGPVTVTEGTQADFKLKLDKAAAAAAVVTVSTGDDPAAANPADATGSYRDYTPLSGYTVTVPAGSLEATVSVATVGDSIDEFDETFLLRIDNVTSTADMQIGTDDEAKGTIADDDPEPAVTIAAASAVESSGSLPFTVTLSRASQKLTSVTAATSAGTAFDARGSVCATTDGSEDYITTTSIVRFASYATTEVFDVPVCDDIAAEPDETLTVTLSSPARATLGSPSTATGTIVDDDVTPEVSISDVAAGENNSVTFTLALDVASPRTVSVTAATSASSPVSAVGVTTCSAIDGSEDYQTRSSTVTFAANTRSATFTVTVCDDTAVEGDETFTVALTSPTNATVSSTAGTAVGTITDDDCRASEHLVNGVCEPREFLR